MKDACSVDDQPPHPSLRVRCEALLGRQVVRLRAVHGGYTAALRLIANLEDGNSAFLKVGATAQTADWLRADANAYEALEGEFLPRVFCFDPGGGWEPPILALEDLSEAVWPPP